MNSRQLDRLVRDEVSRLIGENLGRGTRRCFQCGEFFERHRREHFFCTRSCYGKYHRIPGQVRRLLKGVKD